ncbi:hypothetical protein [Gilvimarinus algae]|uniref:IPTL-CTERM protein sorting domain-containing protein n=1 Tax=Gilvimarinus algae TaxID=3058037 RepID=A0ABT8TCE2_9GAMM|nr:hypothetical protein [Gilvimarinus sp. SDUM040014]MDO3381779.1 hypothetical protein [Gilvimarinus sp. SDUM040014]
MKLSRLSLLAACLGASAAQAAVVITPTTLTTTEDGGNVQYQVVLDSPPDAGEIVTVTPDSQDTSEGSVSGPINFTDADWDTPQYITITPGASGDGNDGDVMYNVDNNSTSTGGAYPAGPVAEDSVTITNQNIDGVVAIIVEPSSGLWITEGTSQIITVSAGTDITPSADVTVGLSTASGEASIAVGSVVLTAGNSYSATFEITAIDDALVDGDLAFTITTASSTSADAAYNGIDPTDITGFAVDNDSVIAPPPPGPAVALPIMNQVGQFILIALLAAFGLRSLRRRK